MERSESDDWAIIRRKSYLCGGGGGGEEEGISAGSTWAGPGEGVNMTKARVLDHRGEEGAWGVI